MSPRSRRHPIWLALLSTLVLVLVSCAPAAETSPGATTGAATEGAAEPEPSGTQLAGAECPEEGSVTFWTTHSEPDVQTLRQIVEDFNALGGACVRMVQVPGAETDVTRLMTAVRGGIGPDVYMLDRFTVSQRAADGVLTELPQAAELEGDYLEFAWAEAVYQGTPYALPFDTDARALFYRIDV